MGVLLKGVRNSRKNQRFFKITNTRQQDLYLKYAADPVAFIMEQVKTTHPMEGKIPFKLYPFQIKLLYIYLMFRYSVCLKPRQMGISTLVCSYILWLAIFHPYKNILLLSIKEATAKALLRKVVFMYQNMEDWLKLEVINGTGDKIGSSSELLFANGSEIKALAATENAGRSEAVSCIVMDEVAFQRYASTIWTSVQPSISTGGQAILLSSAFGMGNFFHQTYMEAVQKINGFYPVRLNWNMHPLRTEDWYKEQRMLLGKKRVAQEIDCNFLQSGYNVFDMSKIRAIEDKLNDARVSYEDLEGMLKVYFPYDAKHRYTLGGDVSSGKARDYSSFSIYDELGKEYACFKGKITPVQYAHLTMKYGQKYGMADLAPEVNNHGNAVIATYQAEGYPNIYNTTSGILRVGENLYEESDMYGWLTTGKSRNEMITGMDYDLENDLVDMYNPFFVKEAYTFIYSQTNKPQALGKNNKTLADSMYEDEDAAGTVYTDDSIIGSCIGNHVRKNPGRYKAEMPLIGGRGF